MSTDVFEQVRESVAEKRENVAEWLYAAPLAKQQVYLGPADQEDVQAHLRVLDATMERASARTLGVCRVCHGRVEDELLEMDYTADVCLDDLSAEEARSLELELELAKSVQQSLMPQEVPETPGLEVAAFSRPAQIIGGDYFDFFQFQDGAYGLAIADVAGHGISASLHVASVQTLLRALVAGGGSPADVASRMQHLLIHNVRFSTFVTLFLGAYDPVGHVFTYCNAGHNPPLVIRDGGNGRGESLSWLWPTGVAIGLAEEFAFQDGAIHLKPGDLLVLYTDGITEALGSEGQAFGREELAEVVRREQNSSPKDLIGSIREELEAFTKGQPAADDTTLIVCRVTA
jgi:sigma-B regulation protein RsbU (phosphoserine phosphatase)